MITKFCMKSSLFQVNDKKNYEKVVMSQGLLARIVAKVKKSLIYKGGHSNRDHNTLYKMQS